MANEIVNMSQKFKGIGADERNHMLAEGKDRQRFLQSEYSRLGCKGGPRSYGDVGAS